MTREEKAKAEDLGGYFRIPADTRDLNYDKYFHDGSKTVTKIVEYNSENTERLDINGTIEKILTVDYVKKELKSIGKL